MTNRTPRTERRISSLLARAAVIVVLVLAVVAVAGCSTSTTSTTSTTPQQSTATAPSETTQPATQESTPAATQQATETAPAKKLATVSKLVIKDIKKGTGKTATAGHEVTVNYTGWLMDGTEFDSSVGKQPISFVLGTGYVIEGWDKGLVGMKVGGKRELIIPASMGYGDQGYPPVIPGGATLKFEVELVGVK